MYDSFEDFGELLEDVESDEAYDEAFESDEAVRRRGRPMLRRRVPTAKRGNPVPHPVAAGYATKAELNATAHRLDARIATITPQVLELRRQGIQDPDMQRR